MGQKVRVIDLVIHKITSSINKPALKRKKEGKKKKKVFKLLVAPSIVIDGNICRPAYGVGIVTHKKILMSNNLFL